MSADHATALPSRWRSLRYLLATMVRAEPARVVLASLLITGGNVAVLGFAYSTKLAIDAATAGDRDDARFAGVVCVAVLLVSLVARYPLATIGVTLREKAAVAIERRLVSLTARIPTIEHHERPEYLDRVQLLLRSDFEIAEAVANLVDTLAALLLVVTSSLVLGSVHPALALLGLAAVPAFLAGMAKERLSTRFDDEAAPLWRLKRGLREDVAWKAELGPELRLGGAAATIVRRQREASLEIFRRKLRLSLRLGLVATAGDLVFAAGQVAAVAFVAVRAVRGEQPVGDVVLTVLLARQVDGQVTNAIEDLRYLYRLLLAIARLQWLEQHAAAVGARTGRASLPPALREGISVRGLSFRYPGTAAPVLQDVTLDLRAGSIVALVGENGAGKTTLVKLLCRFYDADAGSMSVDGIDLATVDVDAWRSRTTAAFQDFARFELPVRDAVAFGAASDDDVRDALTRAGVADRVTLDERVGRRFAGGRELSGGEWQKLAIARSLVRRAPLLFVLDEPTAALDPHAEHELFETARAASAANPARGVTLFVSHRFSTVRLADLVVVIEDGRVVESGTHDELMARRGRYATLFERQARSYR